MEYSNSKPRSLLILFATIFLIISSCRADPDPLQDFCVANLQATDITVDGFPCKPTSSVVSDDFFFSGLSAPGNTNNMFGSNITQANVANFPGLNTLGLSMNRVDLVPGGVNPLHSHPRATELGFILQGEVLVGFVSTANAFYSKTVKAGESFVIRGAGSLPVQRRDGECGGDHGVRQPAAGRRVGAVHAVRVDAGDPE
ncbi:Germin-like protein 3-8 [Ananas comosus]|uniref:Germin-like protein 3-8 n=1 Tax=Ananas comosus TaxID=4615 RepID=A0A199V2J1_ANACO|nr:Germin-like protein 3-8 [Ananas comosus]